MSLRVTRVQAEVAGQAPSGSLRVTRIQADVAGQVTSGAVRLHKFAVQVLGTDEISSEVYDVSATSSLVLTDKATLPAAIELSAESLIAAVQTAVSNIRSVSATSSLSLTQTTDQTVQNLQVHAESSIELTSEGSAPQIRRKSASNAIAVSDFTKTNFIYLSASNSLELTSSSRKPLEFSRQASSSVNVTSQASATRMRGEAESVIELISIADHGIKTRSASSTLSLTHEAVNEKIVVCSNTLELEQSVIQGVIFPKAESFLDLESVARSTDIRLTASSTLGLVSEADTSIKMRIVSQGIELADEASNIGPRYVSAGSELTVLGDEIFNPDTLEFEQQTSGLSQEANPGLIALQSVQNIVSFAQEAQSGLIRSDATGADAEDELNLSQVAYANITAEAANALTPTQSAVGHATKFASSQIDSLGSTATFVIVRANITGSNTLVVKQACAYVLEQSNTHCLYSPFIGSSSDPNAPTPPPSTYTAAGATPGFRLQYPATGEVTDELILRAPNLGNLDRLSMQRINRETRGGTLIVFADPIWPKVETLLLQFSGLSRAEAQSLLTFMENHLGQEIKLIDWEHRVWTGVISNPQDPIVQDGKGCQFTASFEFEGSKVQV